MTDLTRHLPQCEVTRTARGDLFIQWIRKSGLARVSMGVWGSSCVTAARLVTVNETRSATLNNASAACLPQTCASRRAYTPRSHDDPDDWWLSSRYGWIEKKEVHGVDGGDKQGRERKGKGRSTVPQGHSDVQPFVFKLWDQCSCTAASEQAG